MSYFNTVMADGPAHYYRLDESAAPFVDYGSLANNGHVSNASFPPLFSQPALIVDSDKAMTFGNVNQQEGINVDLPVDSGAIGTQLSVECWVNPSQALSSIPGFGPAAPISEVTDDTFQYGILRVTDSGSGPKNVYILISNAKFGGGGLEEADELRATNVLAGINQVSHIVFTYDGSANFAGDGNVVQPGGKAKLYVNGNITTNWDLGCFRPVWAARPPGAAAALFQIGRTRDGNGGNDLKLDEQAIYLSVLSPARVLAHYNSGIGLASYLKTLSATETPTTFFIHSPRWYIGPFKGQSKAIFRAVYRDIRNIITQNRNLV